MRRFADAGATTTITATYAGTSGGGAMLIQEVSGLTAGTTAAAMLDGTAGTLSSAANTASFSTGTPSYASASPAEYLIALYGDDGDNGAWTWSGPAGYPGAGLMPRNRSATSVATSLCSSGAYPQNSVRTRSCSRSVSTSTKRESCSSKWRRANESG